MSDPSWALQQAIYQRLTNALSPTRVGDFTPADTARPYVTIGDDEVRHGDSKTPDTFLITLTIEVVTDTHRGRRAAKETLSGIHDALHDQELIVAGWELNWLRFEQASTQLSEDGITYRGIARYEAHLSKPE